jgi:hypothetical protein
VQFELFKIWNRSLRFSCSYLTEVWLANHSKEKRPLNGAPLPRFSSEKMPYVQILVSKQRCWRRSDPVHIQAYSKAHIWQANFKITWNIEVVSFFGFYPILLPAVAELVDLLLGAGKISLILTNF